MTKDEYEDFVLRYKGCGACFPMYHTLSQFEKMWFTAIQKDVAELEKENAELKLKLKTAYRKGMRHMAKALKDYDRTDGAWTDYFEHTVDKVLQREQLEFEEYGTLADQLTKAKELLAKWVELFKPKGGNIPPTPIQVDTEQFLSEVEK